jgi:hypothetical protein
MSVAAAANAHGEAALAPAGSPEKHSKDASIAAAAGACSCTEAGLGNLARRWYLCSDYV